MIVDVEVTRPGRDATEALARQLAAAQAGDALAPVTVVVPGNLAGLVARRALSAPGVGTGLANVSFVTPFRFAELVALPLVADRPPVTGAVLAAATRRALAEEPGRFASVAEHHATELAATELFAELSVLDEAQLDAVAEVDPAARDSVRLFRVIRQRLHGYRTEQDLLRAATSRPDLHQALAAHGHVVLHGLEPLPPVTQAFLGAVARSVPTSAVVTLVEERFADLRALQTWEGIGIDVPYGDANAPAVADRIISVSDADDEVRAAIRHVLQLLHEGVPAHRIGIFHPSGEPYQRTLEQHLASAGITANGPGRWTLADSAVGRTLLAALQLPDQRWRRDRVVALVADAPVTVDGRVVDPVRIDATSREAGVVHDLADWRHKSAAFRARLQRRLDRADLDPDARTGVQARVESLDDMDRLIDVLDARVGAVRAAPDWPAAIAALRQLLTALFGSSDARGGWPDHEQEAAERIDRVLDHLSRLHDLEPEPGPGTVRRALATELDVAGGRRGRFGVGVFHGPLAHAVGQDLDAVVLLGLVEGACPSPRSDDALVPDRAREVLDGALPLRRDRLHDQHRWFLTALESAPPGRRTICVPRGDLRGGKRHTVSRWALPTAGALAGAPVPSTAFGDLHEPVVEVVRSHATGIRTAERALSLLERDAAHLASVLAAGDDPVSTDEAGPVLRGIAAMRARASDQFTEWDGNLAGQPIPAFSADDSVSATALESWATCGMRYFLRSVLGLGDRDDPERIIQVSALDRGTVLHRIVERFLDETIARGAPAPDAPWTDDDRKRLLTLADEEFDELERRGLSGRAVNWRFFKMAQREVLLQWLDDDEVQRVTSGGVPQRTELAFGKQHTPVTITLPSGRRLGFHGAADRVDRVGDDEVVVYDYKSSRPKSYREIDTDPVARGTHLQLGVYSEAAQQVLGAHRASARFWFLHPDARTTPTIGYPYEGEVRDRFLHVVDTIVDGIEAGAFPALPGPFDPWRGSHESCRYCDFDSVCHAEREDHEAAKADDPALAVRTGLALEEVHE